MNEKEDIKTESPLIQAGLFFLTVDLINKLQVKSI